MNVLLKKRNRGALDRPQEAYWLFLENTSNDFD
jgi:hypothetical protein